MVNLNEYNIITMEDYLINYVNYQGDLNDIMNINHYDLSELNIEGVKRVPNDLVTKEDLMRGSILLVESKGFKHNGKMICAYVRPSLVKQDNELDQMIANSLYKSSTQITRGLSSRRR